MRCAARNASTNVNASKKTFRGFLSSPDLSIHQRRLGCERGRCDTQSKCNSMPETDRNAGPVHFVEHEFAAFEGNGLGLVQDFDKKAGHHPGCWLRRRANRE